MTKIDETLRTNSEQADSRNMGEQILDSGQEETLKEDIAIDKATRFNVSENQCADYSVYQEALLSAAEVLGISASGKDLRQLSESVIKRCRRTLNNRRQHGLKTSESNRARAKVIPLVVRTQFALAFFDCVFEDFQWGYKFGAYCPSTQTGCLL